MTYVLPLGLSLVVFSLLLFFPPLCFLFVIIQSGVRKAEGSTYEDGLVQYLCSLSLIYCILTSRFVMWLLILLFSPALCDIACTKRPNSRAMALYSYYCPALWECHTCILSYHIQKSTAVKLWVFFLKTPVF